MANEITDPTELNPEQLLFNGQLGRDLVVHKAEEKWDSGIVEHDSLDFP